MADEKVFLTHSMSGRYGVFTSYNSRYKAHVFINIRPNAFGTSYIGKRCTQYFLQGD
jgi:hypothetical protein